MTDPTAKGYTAPEVAGLESMAVCDSSAAMMRDFPEITRSMIAKLARAYKEILSKLPAKSAPEPNSGCAAITYDDCSMADANAAEQWAVAYVAQVGVSKESMIDALSTLRAQVTAYGRRLQLAESDSKAAPESEDEAFERAWAEESKTVPTWITTHDKETFRAGFHAAWDARARLDAERGR